VADVVVMVDAVATADVEAMAGAFPEPEALAPHDECMALNGLFYNEDDGLACNICDAPYLVFYKHDGDVADGEVVPEHKNR
jgi:hypothetical protein